MLQPELSAEGSIENIPGPPADVALNLVLWANRTVDDHVVITNRPRNATSGSVDSHHCHSCPTQTTFIHVRDHLTPKTQKTKCHRFRLHGHGSTPTGCLPAGILGHLNKSRMLHNDLGDWDVFSMVLKSSSRKKKKRFGAGSVMWPGGQSYLKSKELL